MDDSPAPEENDVAQSVRAVLDWVDFTGDRTGVIGRLSIYHDWLAGEATSAGGIGPAEGPRLWRRHLADSLTFLAGLTAADREPAGDGAPIDVLDVGSGVGLPGIPLSIALPHINFTLLDRSGRRCDLAARAVRILGLTNVEVLQGDATKITLPHRVAVARAVMAPTSFKTTLQQLLPAGRFAVIGGSHGTDPPADAGFEVIRVPESVMSKVETVRTMSGAGADDGTAWLAKLPLSS